MIMRLVLILALLLPIAATASAPPKLLLQIILNPAIARKAGLGTLANCVAITPDGVAIVSDQNHLWEAGAAGALPVGNFAGLASFAFVPGGLLFGVSGQNLVYLDTDGTLKTLFALPAPGMSVASGAGDSLLLFGPEGGGHYGLYLVYPGHKAAKLFGAAAPIEDAAQAGGKTFFILNGMLFGVTGRQAKLIAAEPGAGFSSVAADPAGNRVFVSDGAHVFQIKTWGALPISGDLGGLIRWYGGGLLIFNPQSRSLIRLLGLP
jgi:hypothetical protein